MGDDERLDERLMARAEQALTEIKVAHGLSEEHAAVLAALRIRLRGQEDTSLEGLLAAADDAPATTLDDVLARPEERPATSLDDLLNRDQG